jgi:hypothetical protein
VRERPRRIAKAGEKNFVEKVAVIIIVIDITNPFDLSKV